MQEKRAAESPAPAAEPAAGDGVSKAAATEPPRQRVEKPPAKDLLEQRLQVTESWLQDINPKHYTIQLLATVASERRSLLAFLDRQRQRQRNGLEQFYIYQTSISGRAWYSVVFGNFSSYSAARSALAGLPRDLARHSPFIRNLSDLRARG